MEKQLTKVVFLVFVVISGGSKSEDWIVPELLEAQ